MDRRRAAGLLLALAACFATATAAPTASDHTALDLYDGASDGCYYNFQHYGEGDRIMTNEPCLNCTCHNRMLMCYLRVCPFTKPIGQDCTIEKRADQCCPIVTCPDVPVDLLTSTTTSPAEYGSTGIGKLDKFGCSLNGKYFPEGSKVPPSPNKPCEHCYCIRNMTTCVMQECTLHVDGCTPIYHKDVCCPVRYSCDHPEDEMPLLDDLSTTVRPTPGFLLTTTTISPVTQMSQDCVYDNRVFSDGALIKTDKACDHCYCMKGDIVCVVQECGTPMENEGKNCTALPPREGVCCPDTYICEGDEPTTGTYDNYDFSTHEGLEKLTTLSPPRRTSSEGSGYRNEPDETPYTEPEVEGSGEEDEQKSSTEPFAAPTPAFTDDILASTEETHEFIPLTTVNPISKQISEKTTARVGTDDKSVIDSDDEKKTSESLESLPSTTDIYSKKDGEPVTDKTYAQSLDDEKLKPNEDVSETPTLPIMDENVVTTEINDVNIVTSSVTDTELYESQAPITSAPIDEDKDTSQSNMQDITTSGTEEKTTPKLPTEHDNIAHAPEVSTTIAESTERIQISVESTTNGSESNALATTSIPFIEKDVKNDEQEDNFKPETYRSSTTVPSIDDEYVTTETQEHELITDISKETDKVEIQHATTSTPMLEEIEKDTTEYNIVPSDVTQDNTFNILSTTTSNIPSEEQEKDDVTKAAISQEHTTKDYIIHTTKLPVFDQQEMSTVEPQSYQDIPTDSNVKEISELESLSPSTIAPAIDDSGRRTKQPDHVITIGEDDSKVHDISSISTATTLRSEEVTTEPDKGLNTIPSDLIDEEVPVPSDTHQTTVADDTFTTVPVFDFITSSLKTTILPDTSVPREEPATLTTESAFRKEDYNPTESQTSPEFTTLSASVTEEVTSSLPHDDQTMSTESKSDIHEINTTSEPKYTESFVETTLHQETSDLSHYESSTGQVPVSEKDYGLNEDVVTSEPPYDKTPETTTVNQKDNEIFSEPRIPGEGDCLLDGVRYMNESAVPSTNKCQSGCKCISSIIKCDPIICSPPTEYMNNCETVYDSPEACCPTYICDYKTETIPPQSHSQMSGTEAPSNSPVHCQGNECEIIEDKKHYEKPSEACTSGGCADQPDQSQQTGSHPSTVPEKPTIEQNKDCIGDKCIPVLCTEENGCQATPVKPCEGEECVASPGIVTEAAPSLCVKGKDCTEPNIPTDECTSDNCIPTDIHSEESYPKDTCTDKEGCRNIPHVSEEECKEENCKKIEDSTLEQPISEQCTDLGCKQPQPNFEVTTASVLETSQDILSVTDEKEAPTKETGTTDEFEIFTKPSHHTESIVTTERLEIVTKQPEMTSNDSLTTPSDKSEIVTKFEAELEATTELIDFENKEVTISTERLPEKYSPVSGTEEQYPSVSTESALKDVKTNAPLSDDTATETSKLPVPMFIDEHVTKDDTEPTEPSKTLYDKSTTEIIEDNTELPDIYTINVQKVTDSVEQLETEKATQAITTQSSTTSQNTDESSTKASKSDDTEHQEITKLPEAFEHQETTPKYVQESSTLSPEATKSQEITGSPDVINQDETTNTFKDESFTEISMSTNAFTEKNTVESGTKPSTTFNIEEQSQEIDHTKTTEEFVTKTPAVGEIEHDTTTMKEIEKIEDELPKPTIVKSEDVTKGPEENEDKDISSIVTEKSDSSTDLLGSPVTESQEIIKDSGDNVEVTTSKDLVGPSNKPVDYTVTLEKEVTQDAGQEDTTKFNSDETGTTAHTELTESQKNTEPKQETSTELPHVSVTDQYELTSKISAQPTTDSSKIYTIEEQQSTTSPEKTDHAVSTTKVSEENLTEPPTTFGTKSYENVDYTEATTSKYYEKVPTEPSQLYSTKQQEETKPPNEKDYDERTETVIKESSTEPSKDDDSEEKEFEPVTNSPITHSTDGFKTSEGIESITTTTTNAIDESATEPSRTDGNKLQSDIDSELPDQYITESDKETSTLKPSISVELSTEEPKEKDKSTTESEPVKITTAQEITLESAERTTPSSALEPKITTLEEARPDETTRVSLYDSTSLPQNADISAATETSIKEQPSTTHIPTKHDHTAEVPLTTDSDQKRNESQPDQQVTLKPDLEAQIDSHETVSTQQPVFVKEPTDMVNQVPAFESPDELRTTSSEMQDLTTRNPDEVSHDLDKGTEYPDISSTLQQERTTESLLTLSQDVTTKGIKPETEIPPVLEEEMKTEKSFTVKDMDSSMETDSKLDEPQTSPQSKPTTEEENFTEEHVTKYSSPKPTTEYDTTKSYPDKILPTVEPVYHETKEPEKPSDVQSLVTVQYETSTKSSNLEIISQTTSESDSTQLTEQDKLTDSPSKLPDTTIKQDEKVESVTTTNYPKETEEIRTESPISVDETTSQKEHPLKEVAISEQPSKSEQNEFTSTTMSGHGVTTELPHKIPFTVDDIETITTDGSFTEKQEFDTTDKSLTETKATVTEDEQTPVPDHDNTESEHEATKAPAIEAHDHTEPSKVSPEASSVPEKPSPEPDNEDNFSAEPMSSDVPELEKTSSTEATKVTEAINTPLSPDIYTEKQPETIQTVTPENITPGEEYLTTRKQLEPEEYKTTLSEDTKESSSHLPALYEEGSITSVHENITPASNEDEISSLVVTPEIENVTTSAEYVTIQTERVPSAPGKPLQETTAPEEEFLLATSKPTTTKVEEEISTSSPATDRITRPTDKPEEVAVTKVPAELITTAPETPMTDALDETITSRPEAPILTETEAPMTEETITAKPETPIVSEPEAPMTEETITTRPEASVTTEPEAPMSERTSTTRPEASIVTEPETHMTEEAITTRPEAPIPTEPEAPVTKAPEEPITVASKAPISSKPKEPIINVPEEPITTAPETPIVKDPESAMTNAPREPISTTASEAPIGSVPEAPMTSKPEETITTESDVLIVSEPETFKTNAPEESITNAPEAPITTAPEKIVTTVPEAPISRAPEEPITTMPEASATTAYESPASEVSVTTAYEVPVTTAPATRAPEAPITEVPEAPITNAPEAPTTKAPEAPATTLPEIPKPVSTEAHPTDDLPTHDEEAPFPPSSGTSGYGPEPSDYGEEDQTFGPGTCRYGGKVYVSAQQIPRDDPCDFCFCFRSDIICLQQSCPPPIHGCHEEPIQGFCCPRYECPVSMATTVNVTTTTTTTTTTLPPHFPTHSYKGSVHRQGCQIKGHIYKVGDVVRASSGPCLHCTCGGDGQMKCDPKVCTPEPMLRQMIAAAVAAKRRR